MGRVVEVDPDQRAALQRLRAAFGHVLVLEVVEHDQEPPTPDEPAGEDQPPDRR
jgi:hypothetical protein